MGDLREFNANDYEDSRGEFEPLPQGEYRCLVEAAEVKQTRAGDDMIAVIFQVTEGEFANRKIFANFNLWHSSETASRIAREQFATLARAAGLPNIADSAELVDAVVVVYLALRRRKDTGEMANECKSFSGANAIVAPAPAAAAKPSFMR